MSERNIGLEILEGIQEIKAFEQGESDGLVLRNPTDRVPTHPGEVLLEEFLNPMGLTQRELAAAIHVSYQRINEIINGKRGVTPATALRLACYFGMSAGF